MAYIEQIDEHKATGVLQRVYDAAKSRAGGVANIIKVMSLDARANQASIQLYASLMKTQNSLNAASREIRRATVFIPP